MQYSGVIFDLDGTLLDTIEDITDVLNRVLGRRGLPVFSIEDCKKMVGEGMETLMKRAAPGAAANPSKMALFVDDFRREYETAWKSHSRPYPGVVDLLEALGIRGVRTAVLSNKSHSFTLKMTKELLAFPFDLVLGALPGVPLKPDPSAALFIASELRLPSFEIVFVGDTAVDMETARAAGMFPAGALWGFRDASELESGGAALLLKKPGDLLGLFNCDGRPD